MGSGRSPPLPWTNHSSVPAAVSGREVTLTMYNHPTSLSNLHLHHHHHHLRAFQHVRRGRPAGRAKEVDPVLQRRDSHHLRDGVQQL